MKTIYFKHKARQSRITISLETLENKNKKRTELQKPGILLKWKRTAATTREDNLEKNKGADKELMKPGV